MDRIAAAVERRARQNRIRLRNWYRSQMDCGEEGCGECRVCRHFDFQEYVHAVAPSDIPCSVSYDPEVVAYLSRRK
jgi:hypothetical protein